MIKTAALMLALLTGCTSTSAPPTTNQPQVKSVELTEPWKSMNLPIDGAIIELSDDDSLGLRFVTIQSEDAALPYAALKDVFVKRGWVVKYERTGPPDWKARFEAPGYVSASLSIDVESGRPRGWIRVRKAE